MIETPFVSAQALTEARASVETSLKLQMDLSDIAN
jgi:hypothetical protein